MGLDPTVKEIDHLSSLFTQVFHFAPMNDYPPPASFIKHKSPNIKIIPMIPAGGENIIQKLKHVFLLRTIY